jgi:hypothetical protein
LRRAATRIGRIHQDEPAHHGIELVLELHFADVARLEATCDGPAA